MTSPKLRRVRFDTWLAPEGVDPEQCPDADAIHAEVTIAHQDQLKAELMAAQRGVDLKRQPMALTSLWLYCAMARTGLVSDKYDTWRVRLLNFDKVTDPDQLDDDDDDAGDVHPTEASTSSD